MAHILDDISRTFDEFLLLPGLTEEKHVASNVSLRVPLARHKVGEESRAYLNIPFVSAAMQAVSGPRLAIALARKGGSAFIFASQTIQSQAEMVRTVKEHKAGFVVSDSNLPPTASLADAVALSKRTGHSTIAITEGGRKDSKLLGLLTENDFWEHKDDLSSPVSEFFVPIEQLVVGHEGLTLAEATEILWKNKKRCLPLLSKEGELRYIVFRKDYYDHKTNPDELTDGDKRLFVSAALNTYDYQERAAALIEAGVDCLCVDSSDGHSAWQGKAVVELRKKYGDKVILGGGNIVSEDAFLYLVEEAGVDFVKVGIGGGSICITREQKGIGRGQASALQAVVAARDEYAKKKGIYVPVCSDGALNTDTHLIIALAMGADFLMMGKYFAMTEESPPKKVAFKGRLYKPYWGEGSNRARNWQRYKDGSDTGGLLFEEGVDAYVPYAGPVGDKLMVATSKLKAAMCNVGALSIGELHQKAVLTRVSEMTLVEGGTSRVEQLDRIEREWGN